MNENTVLKNSIKLSIIGLLLFIIISFITRDSSYIGGYLVGYGINVITFLLIIQSSTLLLNLRGGSSGIIMAMFIIKLLLYALGFFLAFKVPNIFNIIGVFVGYFVIKVTIYLDGHRNKGGEQNE